MGFLQRDLKLLRRIGTEQERAAIPEVEAHLNKLLKGQRPVAEVVNFAETGDGRTPEGGAA